MQFYAILKKISAVQIKQLCNSNMHYKIKKPVRKLRMPDVDMQGSHPIPKQKFPALTIP